MATTQLVTHCGARQVTRGELDAVQAPAPTATWFPVRHSAVIDTVSQSLAAAGFTVARAQFALSRGDHRLFGTLDLTTGLAGGVSLAVGIRNSTDKSFPLGFVAGSRVFVCDNLAFRSDLLVNRKHTRFGQERFAEAIAAGVKRLPQFVEQEAARVERFRSAGLADARAESLILRAWERDLVSHRQLPGLVKEWRAPAHDEFKPRTVWSLFNAFTEILKPRQKSDPQRFARQVILLQGFLDQELGLAAEPALAV